MRMHLHLPLAWGLAWTAVGFGTAGAAEPPRRAPIRDSQVVAAQGYDADERVIPGSYDVEDGAVGGDITPISAELQEAAAPGSGMYDTAIPAYAEGMAPGGGYPAGGYYPPPGPDDSLMYQRSPLEQGQLPPGMQPWPGVSPYDHRFDQTVNRDGIWFRNIFDGPNKKYFGTELLLVSLRQVNRETQRIGYPVFRTTLSMNRHRDLAPMDGPLETTGLRLFAGIQMPDQSGAEASAFLTGDPDDIAPLAASFGSAAPTVHTWP